MLSKLEAIQTITSNISLHPSASLQFVPYDATRETKLPEPLRSVLSFAEQKLGEVVILSHVLSGRDPSDQLAVLQTQWATFEQFSPANSSIQDKLKNLTTHDFQRSLSYTLRLDQQLPLPALPTTTIGSFPQTAEVRKLRVKYKRGELSEAAYQAAIDAQIAECIKLQEEIGIDVLVHGEFERTDMVEYFGQQLSGFAFTENGWVQSYGSRYVRPPIIYGEYSPSPTHDCARVSSRASFNAKTREGNAHRSCDHSQLVLSPHRHFTAGSGISDCVGVARRSRRFRSRRCTGNSGR